MLAVIWTFIGLSALAGVVLGRRTNVFALVPAVLGMLFIAILFGWALHVPAWSILATVVFAGTLLQLGYLIGASATIVGSSRLCIATQNFGSSDGYARQSNLELLHIKERMEVVGSDGEHVGTIDHSADTRRIVLTGDDPRANGRPHLISIDWVDYVSDKVHLNKPSDKIVSEWLAA